MEIEDCKTVKDVLEAITEGRGRYSMDHHQHAKNTIEDMKALARRGLKLLPGGKPVDVKVLGRVYRAWMDGRIRAEGKEGEEAIVAFVSAYVEEKRD